MVEVCDGERKGRGRGRLLGRRGTGMQTSWWRCVMGDGREEKGAPAHQGVGRKQWWFAPSLP